MASDPIEFPQMFSMSWIPMGGISTDGIAASGSISVNLATVAVSSSVAGLPPGDWKLHLIDNDSADRNSTLPTPGEFNDAINVLSNGSLTKPSDFGVAIIRSRLLGATIALE